MKIKVPPKYKVIASIDDIPTLFIIWLFSIFFSFFWIADHKLTVISVMGIVLSLCFFVYIIVCLLYHLKISLKKDRQLKNKKNAISKTDITMIIDPSKKKTDITDVTRENRDKLLLLFEAMEVTMFICRHNINIGNDGDKAENFRFEYYKDYVNGRLKTSFSEPFISKDESDMRDFLKKGAKCVYDININRIFQNDLMNAINSEIDAHTQAVLLNNLLNNSNNSEKMDYYEKQFDLQARDGYRNTLEKLIDSVFYSPESVKKGIENHWSSGTMRAFERQNDNRAQYSRGVWRSEMNIDWID
jgi:Ca2+/Na+ antiporter